MLIDVRADDMYIALRAVTPFASREFTNARTMGVRFDVDKTDEATVSASNGIAVAMYQFPLRRKDQIVRGHRASCDDMAHRGYVAINAGVMMGLLRTLRVYSHAHEDMRVRVVRHVQDECHVVLYGCYQMPLLDDGGLCAIRSTPLVDFPDVRQLIPRTHDVSLRNVAISPSYMRMVGEAFDALSPECSAVVMSFSGKTRAEPVVFSGQGPTGTSCPAALQIALMPMAPMAPTEPAAP